MDLGRSNVCYQSDFASSGTLFEDAHVSDDKLYLTDDASGESGGPAHTGEEEEFE